MAVFVLMLLESACIPIPSEVTMVFGGFLVSRGLMDLWALAVVGTLANVAGSILAYYVGLKGGRPFLQKYGKYLFIHSHRLELADRWFSRYGEITVFTSRLLPAIRTFISLPAGIAKMNFPRFVIYTTLGCFPWSLFLAYVGFLLGENWESVLDYYHRFEYLVIALLAASVLGFIIWRTVKKQINLAKKESE